MTAVQGWAWPTLVLVIGCLLAVDLRISRRTPRMSRAVLVSAAWIGAGVIFGLVVTASLGGSAGQEYFTAYLLEKALSVDNLFVFAVLFQAFAIPAAYQHRVLFFGVLGALVLRGAFIVAGAALIDQLSWALTVFGAVLLVAAVGMARGGSHIRPERGLALRTLRKLLPVTEDYHGARFLTRRDGKLSATPLLAALVAIETADVIFAIDSIPAAFGVTTDAFIVFSSNAFALLGLRALYFVLAGAMERFTYLSQGLAVMLAFIGAKMILAPVIHLPTATSLAAIVVIIATAILLSVWKRRRGGGADVREPDTEPRHAPAEAPAEVSRTHA